MSLTVLRELLKLVSQLAPLEGGEVVWDPARIDSIMNHPLQVRGLCHRLEYVLGRCTGKRVLHVGCADAEYLEVKLREGALLHQWLQRVATQVVGIDPAADAVRRMREAGIEDVYPLAVEEVDSLPYTQFDVIVLGEVLEHLPSPGCAMEVLGRHYPDAQVVITVPNAFSWENLGFLARGWEYVHDDHCCYFSETTLRGFLRKCGYSVHDMAYYTYHPANSAIFGLLSRYPFLAEGIVATAVVAARPAKGVEAEDGVERAASFDR